MVSFEHKQTFHMLSDPRRINLMASKKVPSRPCRSSWEGPRPTTYKPLVEARKRLRQSGNDAREQNFVRETLPLPLTPNDMSQVLPPPRSRLAVPAVSQRCPTQFCCSFPFCC